MSNHKIWIPGKILSHLHTFFCKNIVYKNIEPHILPTLKNILIAQNVSDLEMFLFCFEEAEKRKNWKFSQQRGDFWAIFGPKWAFLAKIGRKISVLRWIRTLSLIFAKNLRTCKKGSNLENLRTTEPQKNYWFLCMCLPDLKL